MYVIVYVRTYVVLNYYRYNRAHRTDTTGKSVICIIFPKDHSRCYVHHKLKCLPCIHVNVSYAYRDAYKALFYDL